MSTSSNHRPKCFSWPIRVYYEDTDAGGVVYHAQYLAFFERARTEWLRSLGYEQDRLRETHGILFAVRRVQVEYQSPALFNEALTLVSTLTRAAGASLDFEQSLQRNHEPTRCCLARVKVACIQARTLKPTRLPDDLLALLAPLVTETPNHS